MKVADVYEKYQIPPWLALHMYRVAAVAATLFDARGLFEGRNELIAACLLHDMGNILKFDFNLFPEFYGESEKEHWQKVQAEYREKYGNTTHSATDAIAKELGISDRTFEILQSLGFSHAEENEKSNDVLKKIATYADMRVMPSGVKPLPLRLADLRVRYAGRNQKRNDEKYVERQERALHTIECELFNGLSTLPQDITEESTLLLREQMQSFDIGSVLR